MARQFERPEGMRIPHLDLVGIISNEQVKVREPEVFMVIRPKTAERDFLNLLFPNNCIK